MCMYVHVCGLCTCEGQKALRKKQYKVHTSAHPGSYEMAMIKGNELAGNFALQQKSDVESAVFIGDDTYGKDCSPPYRGQ